MDKLIEALQILLHYGNERWPTHCEHDTLWIMGIDWADISKEDQEQLTELGFYYNEADDAIQSYRFGSA